MPLREELPVIVIGAGPVGLAAASRLVERGVKPLVFEKGSSVGATLLEWGHVRVFSPWRYNIDDAAERLLAASGWSEPNLDYLPTGGEIVEQYLRPLSQVSALKSAIKLGATVTAITRYGHSKVSSDAREASPFVVRYEDQEGEHDILAQAVIDASGTWWQPNPTGVNGLSVTGERAAKQRVSYGIPDVVGVRRSDFLGKQTLVIGSGHSAINVALALMELQDVDPDTKVSWALRHHGVDRLLGGGLNDQLPERGALGLAARRAMDEGRLNMLTGFSAERIAETEDKISIRARAAGKPIDLDFDQIVVCTGFRPDLSFLRELRVELDPIVEAPPALAPLIDPNLHSCGTVPPHGVEELRHPEADFYIVGSKSYGRAPTFLMKTGYEQVRSVVAEIAGDRVAARRVELVLPETGVCNAAPISDERGSCCGGPAAAAVDACCLADAVAKEEGKSGCGCGCSPSVKETHEAMEPA